MGLQIPIVRARRSLATARPTKLAWYDALSLSVGALSVWPDSSGNGYDTALQGTGTKRPTVTAGQFNGQQTVLFDGGDTLALPSGLYTLTQGDHTIIALAKRNLENATIQRILGAAAGVTARIQFGYTATAGQCNFACNSGGTAVSSSGNTNTNYQLIVGRKTGTTQFISVNNTNSNSDSNGTNVSGTDTFFIGSNRDTDRYLTGGIGEIRIYGYSLSAAELSIELNDMVSRWGGPTLS